MCIKSDNPEVVGTHVFERSGCGRAPFRLVRIFERRGPERRVVGGVEMQVGSPGQAMGSCQHCGTGIAICCEIMDADGKTFVVGSTCVEKTGDSGLIRSYKSNPMKREMDRLRRVSLDQRKTEEIDQIMSDHKDFLKNLPHPKGFKDFKTGEPMTLFDYCVFMRKACGASGRHRLLKFLKETLNHHM